MRSASVTLTLIAALVLSGCAAQVAPVRPMPAPATPAPASVHRASVPRTASARAAIDSLPTSEALAVLASLPEPQGVSDVPAPQAPQAPPAPESPAASDTAVAVPVPVPTSALGQTPPPMPSPTPAAPPASAAVHAPVHAPVQAPVHAAADTCWRVQIAAPLEREKGDAMREMAESQLVTPMVVDQADGRYKVRSRDCLARAAAVALRERALASGFKGVFLVAKVTGR